MSAGSVPSLHIPTRGNRSMEKNDEAHGKRVELLHRKPGAQTSRMLSRPAIILTTLLITTTRAALVPPPTTTSLSQTLSPLSFLGIDCYHLSPSTEPVSLLACQPLFAALVRHGHIYKPKHFYNGFNLQTGQEPCVIRIFSPAEEDRLLKIELSVAQIISYATEVLERCQGTGGANVFEGSWSVGVSRNYIKNEWGAGFASSADDPT